MRAMAKTGVTMFEEDADQLEKQGKFLEWMGCSVCFTNEIDVQTNTQATDPQIAQILTASIRFIRVLILKFAKV